MKINKESRFWFISIIFVVPVLAGMIIDEIFPSHITLGQIVMVLGVAAGLYFWSQLPEKCYFCDDTKKGPKIKLSGPFDKWVHKSCLEEVNKKEKQRAKDLEQKEQ